MKCEHSYRDCTNEQCMNICNGREETHLHCNFQTFCDYDETLCDENCSKHKDISAYNDIKDENKNIRPMNKDLVIENIPEEFLKRMKPCWKCGKLPVRLSRFGYSNHLYMISCPDENCHNNIILNGYEYPISANAINKWNEKNIEKYIPKSELKETENCNKCKHIKNCIYMREQYIHEYCTGHICDDFMD